MTDNGEGKSEATKRGFPIKLWLPGKAYGGSAPLSHKGWVAITRSGGQLGHDDQWVTDEEVIRLQRVSNDNMIIPKEKLARNRKYWRFSLIGKFLSNRVLDSDFLTRTLCRSGRLRGLLISSQWKIDFRPFKFNCEDDNGEDGGPLVSSRLRSCPRGLEEKFMVVKDNHFKSYDMDVPMGFAVWLLG